MGRGAGDVGDDLTLIDARRGMQLKPSGIGET